MFKIPLSWSKTWSSIPLVLPYIFHSRQIKITFLLKSNSFYTFVNPCLKESRLKYLWSIVLKTAHQPGVQGRNINSKLLCVSARSLLDEACTFHSRSIKLYFCSNKTIHKLNKMKNETLKPSAALSTVSIITLKKHNNQYYYAKQYLFI